MTLLTKAYTSIPPEKAAEYLGLSNDVVIPGTCILYLSGLIVVLQQKKWTYDAEKNLLVPGKVSLRITPFWCAANGLERKAVDQRAEFADFTRLTEIAMVLKGR